MFELNILIKLYSKLFNDLILICKKIQLFRYHWLSIKFKGNCFVKNKILIIIYSLLKTLNVVN